MDLSTRLRSLLDWKSDSDRVASDRSETSTGVADQRKHNYAVLNRLCVDVGGQIRINDHDPNEQTSAIREHRFTIEKPNLDGQVWLSHDPFRSFIQNSGCRIHDGQEINEDFIEKAAQGIETEGAKLDKIDEAQDLANELRKVKGMDNKKILECCVKLYTAETFLYRLINKVMREADMCKGLFVTNEDREYGRTLGPYCALLERYLRDNPNQKNTTVYRCATITDETLNDYKRNIGWRVWWDAFSSTTKNKQVACRFGGNALFIIHIHGEEGCCTGVDISSLSCYAAEEEILLHPGIQVSIEKVDYDSDIEKHVIELQLSD